MLTTKLSTVDTTTLETVTGGAIRTAGGTDATLASITSVLNSLQSVNTNNGCNGGFGNPTTMMLFCMLAMQRNNNNVVYVAGPRRWGWGC